MIELRPYQRQALDSLYSWFDFNSGNPCIEAPTGAGKSYIIAQFCKENLERNPGMRIVMATHVRELVEQDHKALLNVWPDAPCGVFSAGLGRRDMGFPITVCGIQSVYRKYADFGKVDVLIVDEAHLIPAEGTGMYLSFIEGLKETNPNLTVIGLTATPYRLKHGMITDKPAIFDAPLIKTISIAELQRQGSLAMLRSKATDMRLDPTGVRMQGGDFVESELQRRFDDEGTSKAVVEETLERAEGRRHIIFFCCGIEHAEHVRDMIRAFGESAETVSSRTPVKDRDSIIEAFKRGDVRCLTNTSILTTGFDFPDIDCIVMMRPTMSPGLYMQIAGRGLRPKSDGGDCLVLDFAGNIQRHGPITDVRPPGRKRRGRGVAPSKVCPECDEIVAVQTMRCPSCGYEWPRRDRREDFHLHDDDIQGKLNPTMKVGFWRWTIYHSRKRDEQMIKVVYRRSMVDTFEVSEYYPVWRNDGYGALRLNMFMSMARRAGVDPMDYDCIEDCLLALNGARRPESIDYKINGRYANVARINWGGTDV